MYTPGLWILFLYRLGRSLNHATKRRPILRIFRMAYNYFYFWVRLLVGIDIPLEARIDEGLYIGHFGGITVHPETVLGKNCNISHGVTIGEGGRFSSRGVPRIGDRVYIGPGAKIFGAIRIGNDVAIGANAVVADSVPDKSVVGGIPARILSDKGSQNFVIV
jgi:serine O-acetyltransferase